MTGLVAAHGYHATTIEHIVKQARISRATFYENFENREDCLLAVLDEAARELHRQVEDAVAETDEWPEQVRAALAAFLDYAESEPALARTCLVEAVTAGPVALERYERALQSFAPLLQRGRDYLDDASELPETLEDMVIGGIVWMVHQRLLRDEVDQIREALPTTLKFALTPYIGELRAAEVASG